MQRPDRFPRHVRAAIVRDNVVRDREPRIARRLCRHYATGLFFALVVARHQPGHLRLLAAVDQQNAVHRLPDRRLVEQRHDDDDVRTLRVTRLAEGLFADQGMQDGLQAFPAGLIREHDTPQCSAVQCAIAVQYAGPECLDDTLERRLTGFDDLPRHDVRVDDRHAQLGEESGHHRLAAGDTAGQADQKL